MAALLRVVAQVGAVGRPRRAARDPGPGDGVPGAHEARQRRPPRRPRRDVVPRAGPGVRRGRPARLGAQGAAGGEPVAPVHGGAGHRAAPLGRLRRLHPDPRRRLPAPAGRRPGRPCRDAAKAAARELLRDASSRARTPSARWCTTSPACSAASSCGSTTPCVGTRTERFGGPPARVGGPREHRHRHPTDSRPAARPAQADQARPGATGRPGAQAQLRHLPADDVRRRCDRRHRHLLRPPGGGARQRAGGDRRLPGGGPRRRASPPSATPRSPARSR